MFIINWSHEVTNKQRFLAGSTQLDLDIIHSLIAIERTNYVQPTFQLGTLKFRSTFAEQFELVE